MQVIAQDTINMYSMLMLGDLGACPPMKIRSSEIEFEGISGS